MGVPLNARQFQINRSDGIRSGLGISTGRAQKKETRRAAHGAIERTTTIVAHTPKRQQVAWNEQRVQNRTWARWQLTRLIRITKNRDTSPAS